MKTMPKYFQVDLYQVEFPHQHKPNKQLYGMKVGSTILFEKEYTKEIYSGENHSNTHNSSIAKPTVVQHALANDQSQPNPTSLQTNNSN